jgi:hypothetical protein
MRSAARTESLEKYGQAQQLLERLKPRAEGSRKLDAELAEIHARTGAVQRAARDRAAIESYRQAEAGYRTLTAHDPSNARWQKRLAEATTALEALQRSGAARTTQQGQS